MIYILTKPAIKVYISFAVNWPVRRWRAALFTHNDVIDFLLHHQQDPLSKIIFGNFKFAVWPFTCTFISGIVVFVGNSFSSPQNKVCSCKQILEKLSVLRYNNGCISFSLLDLHERELEKLIIDVKDEKTLCIFFSIVYTA